MSLTNAQFVSQPACLRRWLCVREAVVASQQAKSASRGYKDTVRVRPLSSAPGAFPELGIAIFCGEIFRNPGLCW